MKQFVMGGGGLIDHPLRTFTVTRSNASNEELKGHTASVDGGTLVIIVVKSGMPYIVRGYAEGTWSDYSGSLPSDHEVAETRAKAEQTMQARAAFDELGDIPAGQRS